MVTQTMNEDYGYALAQWPDNPDQQNMRALAVILGKHHTAVGGSQQLHKFMYRNPNDPTLGQRFLKKITNIINNRVEEGGTTLSVILQNFMEEFVRAAGYGDVASFDREHQSGLPRPVRFCFGDSDDQKGNDNGIEIQKAVGHAFGSLIKKAERAAVRGPAPQPQQPMMSHHATPHVMPQGVAHLMSPLAPHVMPQGVAHLMSPQAPNVMTPGSMAPGVPPQPVQTPGGAMYGYGYGQPMTPSQQQSMYPQQSSMYGVNAYGGVHGPHSHHSTPLKGQFFHSATKENVDNGQHPSVAGLTTAVSGLDIRAASSVHQDSYVSSFRGGNEDMSSIGGTEGTDDTLVQTPKRTEEQLMSLATFLGNPLHQKWLKLLESQKCRHASRACTSTNYAVYRDNRNAVLIAVEQTKPANPFLFFKEHCMNENSVYDEEDQRVDSKIKETKGTLQSHAVDFEEQKIRLQTERKEKEDELDAQYQAKILKYQAEILDLKNRIALLPSECEKKKAQVNAECDASIVKLQTRHEEQERILNRKLQSYKTAKEQLLVQKVDNLTYAMAHVHALDLTNEIFTKYEGPVMRDETDDEHFLGEIKRLEDKLDGLLDGIAKKERGSLADIVWNLPFAGIP